MGPKAAKVAQLSKQFKGKVPPGIAIPFGSFRKLFDDNLHPSGVTMFDWLKDQYSRMSSLNGADLSDFQNKFLDELGGVYSQSIKRSRVFVQPFIDKGYGEVKQSEQGYSQALFTASGEVWVNEKLISEGAI